MCPAACRVRSTQEVRNYTTHIHRVHSRAGGVQKVASGYSRWGGRARAAVAPRNCCSEEAGRVGPSLGSCHLQRRLPATRATPAELPSCPHALMPSFSHSCSANCGGSQANLQLPDLPDLPYRPNRTEPLLRLTATTRLAPPPHHHRPREVPPSISTALPHVLRLPCPVAAAVRWCALPVFPPVFPSWMASCLATRQLLALRFFFCAVLSS